MATFFEVQKAALKRMEQAAVIAEQLGFEAVASFISEKMEEMVKRELIVVVAGEVKRGKSALLNALLNEKDPVCPVDADVCTNAVTILRYGKKERIQVYIADAQAADGVRVETIQRSEIPDYVSEANNPNNFKNVFRIEVEIPNELLKEGVVFVDTPGVGSLNVEHAEVTFGFLPNADMLLFVTDTASAVTDTELNFLERGYKYCDCIVYPLTKMDLNAEYEVLLNGNKKKISQKLQIPEEEVQVIPVSSKAKQRYLKKPEREDFYRNSNYSLLEETIWTTIAERQAEVRIQPYLNETEQQLRMILDSLVGQYQVLGNSQAATELERELQKKESEIQQLQADGASWRTSLQLYFSDVQMAVNAVRDRISQEAKTLMETRIREMDTAICEAENYRKLVSEMNHKMICGMMEIRQMLEDGVSKKMDSIRNQMNLDVSISKTILDKMNYQPNADVTVNFPEKKLGAQVIDKGRKIGGSTFGGTAIGAAVGTALGAGIGLLIGGPVGASLGAELGEVIGSTAGASFGTAYGVVTALDKYDISDMNQVRNVLSQHINSTMGNMNTVIGSVTQQLRMMVTDSFDRELRQHIGFLQDNRKHIQEGIYIEKQEIPKKRKALKEKIDKVQMIFDKVSSLQEKIRELRLESTGKKQPETQHRMSSENKAAVRDAEKNTKMPKSSSSAANTDDDGENKTKTKKKSGSEDAIDYGFM